VIPQRGEIYRAEIPGVGRKSVLVVSGQRLNWSLSYVTCARITAVDRERGLPTWVEVPAGAVPALAALSYVLAHDLYVLDKREDVLGEVCGVLPAPLMLRVDQALKVAFDLT
jgi:mRNA-degrading endonuclease toxin of MazEF toxin-antitoxin module